MNIIFVSEHVDSTVLEPSLALSMRLLPASVWASFRCSGFPLQYKDLHLWLIASSKIVCRCERLFVSMY